MEERTFTTTATAARYEAENYMRQSVRCIELGHFRGAAEHCGRADFIAHIYYYITGEWLEDVSAEYATNMNYYTTKIGANK